MVKVRAFIAIDFPNEVVKEVARVQSELRKQPFTGKMTELENLHLTLKFLGEIDEEKVSEICTELRKIKAGEFGARLWNAGTFNHRGKPSIAWIKVGGKGIFDLQSQVDLACSRCGFAVEKRFMSHLTIARVKYVKAKHEFKDHVTHLGVKKVAFSVDNFKILKSELKPMGPTYTLIEEFNLK